MPDSFSNINTVDSPGRRAVAVTPSDTQELADVPKALYVGGAGDISMIGADGSGPVLWSAVPAGSVLPFRPKQIRATGTTATGIVAIY